MLRAWGAGRPNKKFLTPTPRLTQSTLIPQLNLRYTTVRTVVVVLTVSGSVGVGHVLGALRALLVSCFWDWVAPPRTMLSLIQI